LVDIFWVPTDGYSLALRDVCIDLVERAEGVYDFFVACKGAIRTWLKRLSVAARIGVKSMYDA
jgi:hypothetical protein